jgi:NADH-quinone oxidoreductase subunit H
MIGAVRAASSNDLARRQPWVSLIALLMMTGTLSLREISAQQSGNELERFYQPLSFLYIFNLCFAETIEPFDLAECETEVNGGYHTEYFHENGFYVLLNTQTCLSLHS